MAMKKEEKRKGGGRIGVPNVREAYQEMEGNKEVIEEIAKREERREEKEHWRLEHDKTKGYEKHLPPVEDRITTERPPFKKR